MINDSSHNTQTQLTHSSLEENKLEISSLDAPIQIPDGEFRSRPFDLSFESKNLLKCCFGFFRSISQSKQVEKYPRQVDGKRPVCWEAVFFSDLKIHIFWIKFWNSTFYSIQCATGENFDFLERKL